MFDVKKINDAFQKAIPNKRDILLQQTIQTLLLYHKIHGKDINVAELVKEANQLTTDIEKEVNKL